MPHLPRQTFSLNSPQGFAVDTGESRLKKMPDIWMRSAFAQFIQISLQGFVMSFSGRTLSVAILQGTPISVH